MTVNAKGTTTSMLMGQAQTPELSFAEAIRKAIADMQDCLPAVVESYNRSGDPNDPNSNTATVRPLIQLLHSNGEINKRPVIVEVPVLSLGGGGFHINFPIKKGDIGWLKACDRDIELFRQTLSDSKPYSGKIHSFGSSWFIPDIVRGFVIDPEDSEAMVMQHSGSGSRVAVAQDAVRITVGSSKIKVTGSKVSVDSDAIDMNATSKIKMTAPTTEVNGLLVLNGSIAQNNAGGGGQNTATFNSPVKINNTLEANSVKAQGKVLESHTHVSSQPGTNTSAPN